MEPWDHITLEQWARYRRVQMSGEYNMITVEAHEVTGLDWQDYRTIMIYYKKLSAKFEPEGDRNESSA